MNDSIERPSHFDKGIFLELQNQEGALHTPMWLSLRDKPVLTKQIDQATVFATTDAALDILRTLTYNDVHLSPESIMVVAQRTYHVEAHHAFWKRMQKGKEEVTQREDYSFYLLTAQQQLERLNHALINGPDELARSLSRELHSTLLDLHVEVNRYLDKKMALIDKHK